MSGYSEGIRWWSDDRLDGGMQWILVVLPEGMAPPEPIQWRGVPPADMKHVGIAGVITNHLLTRYAIDLSVYWDAINPGDSFQKKPWVWVVGRRCLVTTQFGYDI